MSRRTRIAVDARAIAANRTPGEALPVFRIERPGADDFEPLAGDVIDYLLIGTGLYTHVVLTCTSAPACTVTQTPSTST